MTSPVPHGEGEAVTLWHVYNDGDHFVPPYMTTIPDGAPMPESFDEWKALPVDAYNALLARANTAKVAAELMRARAEKAEAALNRVDRALWDVIGCVEDLNDCECWHNSDPCSRSGKLNAACEVARAALSTQRGEGGA